jgi:hypothetical protein
MKAFQFVGGPLDGTERVLEAPTFVYLVPVAHPSWLASWHLAEGDPEHHWWDRYFWPKWGIGRYERVGSRTMLWMGVR